jgi:hypothetical protein
MSRTVFAMHSDPDALDELLQLVNAASAPR